MNIIRQIFRILVCAVCFLFALAFVGIEGFFLIAGDWLLFENRFLSFLQYSVKILIAVSAAWISLKAIFQRKRSFLKEGVAFLCASLIAAHFLVNKVGWLFVILSLLFTLMQIKFSRCTSEYKTARSE